MTTTCQPVEAEPKAADPLPQVLPEERPLAMPHQDLAISPAMANIARWLHLPGNAIRSVLSFKRHRASQENHHVA